MAIGLKRQWVDAEKAPAFVIPRGGKASEMAPKGIRSNAQQLLWSTAARVIPRQFCAGASAHHQLEGKRGNHICLGNGLRAPALCTLPPRQHPNKGRRRFHVAGGGHLPECGCLDSHGVGHGISGR